MSPNQQTALNRAAKIRKKNRRMDEQRVADAHAANKKSFGLKSQSQPHSINQAQYAAPSVTNKPLLPGYVIPSTLQLPQTSSAGMNYPQFRLPPNLATTAPFPLLPPSGNAYTQAPKPHLTHPTGYPVQTNPQVQHQGPILQDSRNRFPLIQHPSLMQQYVAVQSSWPQAVVLRPTPLPPQNIPAQGHNLLPGGVPQGWNPLIPFPHSSKVPRQFPVLTPGPASISSPQPLSSQTSSLLLPSSSPPNSTVVEPENHNSEPPRPQTTKTPPSMCDILALGTFDLSDLSPDTLVQSVETDFVEEPPEHKWERGKKGRNFQLCQNCCSTTHRLEKCLGPLIDGMLPGCPYHDTLDHDIDDCRSEQAWTPKALLYYFVESRAGRPQLMSTRDWRDFPGAADVKGKPWSISFAMEHSSFYQSYDYGKDSIPSTIPLADPGWTNGTLWKDTAGLLPGKRGYFSGFLDEHVLLKARSRTPSSQSPPFDNNSVLDDDDDYTINARRLPSEYSVHKPLLIGITPDSRVDGLPSAYRTRAITQRKLPSGPLTFQLPNRPATRLIPYNVQTALLGTKRVRSEDSHPVYPAQKRRVTSPRIKSEDEDVVMLGEEEFTSTTPPPAPPPRNADVKMVVTEK